jgi:hypothetical protein
MVYSYSLWSQRRYNFLKIKILLFLCSSIHVKVVCIINNAYEMLKKEIILNRYTLWQIFLLWQDSSSRIQCSFLYQILFLHSSLIHIQVIIPWNTGSLSQAMYLMYVANTCNALNTRILRNICNARYTHLANVISPLTSGRLRRWVKLGFTKIFSFFLFSSIWPHSHTGSLRSTQTSIESSQHYSSGKHISILPYIIPRHGRIVSSHLSFLTENILWSLRHGVCCSYVFFVSYINNSTR